jgi:hypothetical protein
VSSVMPSPTQNTPSERLSHLSMSSMPSNVKDAQSTVSVVKFVIKVWWALFWVCLVVSEGSQ